MGSDRQVWNLSKLRFLQGEASLWIFSNKVLEIVLTFGIAIWLYFEFFSPYIYEKIKYLGLIVTLLAFSGIRSRFKLYEGYFDGYEQGFKDASTCNYDYWGDTHDEFSDNCAINSVLEKIKKNEDRISEENKKSRADEMEKGFSKLMGYILTWRKIN
jgi:hypothetical protein